MSAAQFDQAAQAKRGMLAKVHIARKELHLDEETYRAILVRITGQASGRDCTVEQLGLVLDEFKAKGWKPAAYKYGGKDGKTPARPADHPVAKKARALWISLHQLGAVRDPSERALEAFGMRQLKVERLQWADPSQGYKLIEALKQMAERHGWSQDLTGVVPDQFVIILKRRLLCAINQKLVDADCLPVAPTYASIATLTEQKIDWLIRNNAGSLALAEGRKPNE